MKQLQDMALFVLLADSGTFTATAERAGLPKSSISRRISLLEQRVGLRLINRTTRHFKLTFAGERYLVHCREMVEASERADAAMQRLRDNPSGRLRITCPAGIGATLLAQLNSAFRRRYPDVQLEVAVNDEILDLVQAGFDVALRTGKPQDSSLIGRALGPCPRYLVASPGYLAESGTPLHPRDLNEHRCIVHRAWNEWVMVCAGDYLRVTPDSGHQADNLLYARECAIADGGITLLPAFLLDDNLVTGRLVKVLEQWDMASNDLYLVYPGRKLNSPALACYIDFAMQYEPLNRAWVNK
ncbi:LysR family transcriptional regulator [Salmonella enterica subsp. enterica serovar Choleraesuis]|nr:LysR family transcriptional regulator [Salmonella enterica subsp. enterica serovar Choleraesuis]